MKSVILYLVLMGISEGDEFTRGEDGVLLILGMCMYDRFGVSGSLLLCAVHL